MVRRGGPYPVSHHWNNWWDGMRPLVGTPSDPWYGAEGLDPQRFGQAVAQLFCDQVLRPSPGDRILGCKEIRWTEDLAFFPAFMDSLARFFPNCHFIFQTRSWQQVAKSAWWAKQAPESVAAFVTSSDAAFTRYAAGHANCLLIDYAELIGGPGGFERIAKFLGRDFDATKAQNILTVTLNH